MATLTHAKVWRRTRQTPAPATSNANYLTVDEKANVRRAVKVLRTRLGSATALAEAMGVTSGVIQRACSSRGKVTAGLAIRAARVAGVPVDDVLTGAFPAPGACPHCGRLG
jgi:hypothetical protein